MTNSCALEMNYSLVRIIFKDTEPIAQCVKVSNQRGKWKIMDLIDYKQQQKPVTLERATFMLMSISSILTQVQVNSLLNPQSLSVLTVLLLILVPQNKDS